MDNELQPQTDEPTIFFNGRGYWVCVTGTSLRRYDLERRLLVTGWIYSQQRKWFFTKDDDIVKPFEDYIRAEDRAILAQRLVLRYDNLNLSYQTALPSVYHPDAYPFQNVTPYAMTLRNNILLGDDMGLGKTIQAIMAINEIKPANVLIVVPNALVLQWYDKISEWLTSKETLVYICPWSRLIKMDQKIYWDMCIVDEAHYAKNESSKRSQAFQSLQAKYKLALTGTPLLGNPMDIWPVMQWLEPYVLGNKTWFENRYCHRVLKQIPARGGGYRRVWTYAGGRNVHELQKKLRETIMIARRKSDVLPQLPPKSRSVITLDVGADIKQMESRIVALWEEVHSKGNDIKLWNNIFRLRKECALMKVPKINAFIAEIWSEISSDERRPFVIWAHHLEVIDAIYDHAINMADNKPITVETLDGRKKPDDRANVVKRFQDGEIDVLIAGLTASGTGITLTAADIAIFAELDWTPANLIQAEDRLHRIGQEKNVNIYYCVSPDSLDSRLAGILSEKQHIIDDFNDVEYVLPPPQAAQEAV